jgi:hypothetical protein
MDRAALEGLLPRGLSLEAIGQRFGRHESTVAYWVSKYGLRAANRDRHVARGGIREDELKALVDTGHVDSSDSGSHRHEQDDGASLASGVRSQH